MGKVWHHFAHRSDATLRNAILRALRDAGIATDAYASESAFGGDVIKAGHPDAHLVFAALRVSTSAKM
jgi:hypothetical protein